MSRQLGLPAIVSKEHANLAVQAHTAANVAVLEQDDCRVESGKAVASAEQAGIRGIATLAHVSHALCAVPLLAASFALVRSSTAHIQSAGVYCRCCGYVNR